MRERGNNTPIVVELHKSRSRQADTEAIARMIAYCEREALRLGSVGVAGLLGRSLMAFVSEQGCANVLDELEARR